MRFQVKNSNLFPLPGNPHMLHLGTISSGLREFVVMHCMDGPHKGQTYIEEAVLTSVDFNEDVTANCKFIKDDNLAFDLAKFAEEQKLTDMRRVSEQLMDRGRGSWLGLTGLRKS